MNKLLITVFFLASAFFLFVSPQAASAVDFTCTYSVQTGCGVTAPGCPAGFHDDCASRDPAVCQAAGSIPRPCIVNNATCGALGQPCCSPGNTCNGALICAGNRCVNNVATATPTPTPPGGGGGGGGGASPVVGDCINTAIGCIPVFGTGGTRAFVTFILAWGIGVAGGVAFLLIVYSGFLIMTSVGNPQKLQAGKELLGAAISGVLLLVFSTFILRFVGVDILRIF